DSLFTHELKSGQGCECIATVRFVLDVCGVSDKEDGDESTCPGDGVLDDLRQRIRGVVQGGSDRQEARGSCNDELHEEVRDRCKVGLRQDGGREEAGRRGERQHHQEMRYRRYRQLNGVTTLLRSGPASRPARAALTSGSSRPCPPAVA